MTIQLWFLTNSLTHNNKSDSVGLNIRRVNELELPLIIAHGGAGAWQDERIPIGIEEVRTAAIKGFRVLGSGGSALDAAEICTLTMESCGKLNAGNGAAENSDGERELDAMIVDGSSLSFGSVAAVTGIQNPISLARYIMEKTNYSFFAGQKALRVYDDMIAEEYRKESKNGAIKIEDSVDGGDTVGCVAVDTDGMIATTSSTGGIRKKQPGRVGDSPIMGAGAFANDICGASATGYGEHIMRVTMSRMAVLYVEQGESPQTAAEKAIQLLVDKTGSEAGIILADRNGNWGRATNAKAMPFTVISGTLDSIQSFSK